MNAEIQYKSASPKVETNLKNGLILLIRDKVHASAIWDIETVYEFKGEFAATPSNLALNPAIIHIFKGEFAATPSNLALNLANNDRHPSNKKDRSKRNGL